MTTSSDDDVIGDEIALDALGYADEPPPTKATRSHRPARSRSRSRTDAESVYDSSAVIEDASVVEESAEHSFEDAAEHEVAIDEADVAEDAPVFARTSIAESFVTPPKPAAPPTSPTPTTGSIPSDAVARRVSHPEERSDRVHAVERVTPRPRWR